MTVEGSGNFGGDLGGDFATPSPARENSPEWLGGSRFRLLQASDDEEEDGDVELSPEVADSDGSIRYLCRTPSPVSGIDIVDESRDLARRTIKRIKKRNAQRLATKASMLFASMEGISTWGLPQVFSGSAASSGSELESSQSGVQHVLSASARVLPADGTQAGEPESATCERAVLTAVKERSAVDTDAVVDGTERRLLAQKICMQELPASGLAPLQGTVEQTTSGGSSTPVQTKLSATTVSRPQKIVSASTARDQAVSNNHWPIDGQSLHDQAAAARGSSTHVAPVAHGNVGDPITMGALDLAQETEGEDFKLHGGDGKLNSDDPNRVGIALPLRDIVNPTVEEVIAFGGIPKPSSGMRSSSRLGHQMDGDMPQLDRAMKRAQMWDDPPNTGYSHDDSLGSAMGSPFAGGITGCHGFWMHTAPDGRSGYLVPG